jgi:deoxyribodipyrimidine photo-lyase
MEQMNVYWMRRDLRLNDNHALYEALKSGLPVLPLFILDTDILDELPNDDSRLNLFWNKLHSIHNQLEKAGKGLIVRKGKPLDVIAHLSNEFDIQNLYVNEDYEPYAIQRDQEIRVFLKSISVGFYQYLDQTIFHPTEILKSDGSPYQVFTPYMRAWRNAFNIHKLPEYPSEKHLYNLCSWTKAFMPLNDFGFIEKPVELPNPDLSQDMLKNYHLSRDIPSINGTSKLSVHLRFGFLSIRQIIRQSVFKSDVFVNELIWREFYMMILYHFPKVITKSFKPKYDKIKWINNESDFNKWCRGETGFPIVDAGMRQLNSTGWMHNRLRMITASFLVKDLLIDWRWGEAYFAEKLMDYDLAANNGGWQWAAGSGCDAAPYFRIFNPDSQQKKFDPNYVFIRAMIPEFETKNYPDPMIDHKFARERALHTFAEALK